MKYKLNMKTMIQNEKQKVTTFGIERQLDNEENEEKKNEKNDMHM